MISAIAKKTVKWLLGSGAISQEETELYEFATFSFLFSIVPLVLTITIGIILGMIKESIIMILPFLMLRKTGGGVHLNSPSICFVSSIFLLSGALWLTRLAVANGLLLEFTILVCAATTQFFIYSPVESNARPLAKKERRVFRIVARLLLSCFFALYLIISVFGFFRYAAFLGAGIVLASLLQVPALFKHLRKS